jgi:hypothetical protein
MSLLAVQRNGRDLYTKTLAVTVKLERDCTHQSNNTAAKFRTGIAALKALSAYTPYISIAVSPRESGNLQSTKPLMLFLVRG